MTEFNDYALLVKRNNDFWLHNYKNVKEETNDVVNELNIKEDLKDETESGIKDEKSDGFSSESNSSESGI